MVWLLARHEGHEHSDSHYANIKYGYFALVFSFLCLALMPLRNWLVMRRVVPRKYERYLSLPLVATVLFWFFVLTFFTTVNLESFSVKKIAKRAGR